MNNNVLLWFALDESKQEILINNSEKGKDYICPECNGVVRARAKDSEYVTPHFYHLNKGDCTGENAIHNYWKNNLINVGNKFTVDNIEYECIDKRVEFTFNTKDGIYRPDLVIKTKDNKFIIFEIFYTNKKDIYEYEDKWEELRFSIVEVDVKCIEINNKPIDFESIWNMEMYIKQVKKEVFHKFSIMDDLLKNPKLNINTYSDKVEISKPKQEELRNYLTEDMKKLIKLGVVLEKELLKQIERQVTINKREIIDTIDNSTEIKQLQKLTKELEFLCIESIINKKFDFSNFKTYINKLYKTRWQKYNYHWVVKLKELATYYNNYKV